VTLLVVSLATSPDADRGQPGSRTGAPARVPTTATPPSNGDGEQPSGGGEPAEKRGDTAEKKRGLGIRVVDGNGAPVERALVYLLPVDSAGTNTLPERHAWTDTRGRTRLPVFDRPHRVGIKKPGYRSHRSVLDSSSEAPLEVVLEEGVSIAGRVILPEDARGTVPRNILYETVPSTRRETFEYPGFGQERVESVVSYSADGKFSITGLSAGTRYRLDVRGPETIWRRLDVVAPRSGLAVRLDRSAVVTVRVRNWPDGEDAILRANLFRKGTRELVSGRSLRNPKDGVSTIRDYVPHGTYDLEVEVKTSDELWVGGNTLRAPEPGARVATSVQVAPAPNWHVRLGTGASMDGLLIVYSQGMLREILDAEGRVARLRVRAGFDAIQYIGKRWISDVSKRGPAIGGTVSQTLKVVPSTTITLLAHEENDEAIAGTVMAGNESVPAAVLREDTLLRLGREFRVEPGDTVVVRTTLAAALVVQGQQEPVPLEVGEANRVVVGTEGRCRLSEPADETREED